MSPFQQALGNAKLAITSLTVCLTLSILLNVVFAISLARVPDNIPITITRVPDNGLQLKIGDLPKISAYLIAKNQWEWLNTWAIDGQHDVATKIQQSLKAGLVTAHFINQYQQILQGLKNQGLTSGYKQVTTQFDGEVYDPKAVTSNGDGMIITITMSSLFYYRPDNTLAQTNLQNLPSDQQFALATTPLKNDPIEQITMRYRFIIQPAANQYGMAVTGIDGVPQFIDKNSNFGV